MQPLTVTIIQTVLHWEDKHANLAMFGEKINSIKTHTEIMLLPEMFSTGFTMNASRLAERMDGETVAWMKKIASKKKVIVAGSIIIKEENNFYNRLVWMLPNGDYGCYDKRHLFGYAGEHEYYTSGSKRLITRVKGWRLNILVCYDLRFPVWARQQKNVDDTEYDVLVYVANWPAARSHVWKTLLQARAIENQCYVIGVNRVGTDGKGLQYSGDSMVIDALGNVIYCKHDEEDVFTVTLDKQALIDVRSRFPFLKDADSFNIEP